MYARLASSQLDQAGHLFRICLGAVSAEAMVGKRTMGRSLARGVLVHFLQKHNKQDGARRHRRLAPPGGHTHPPTLTHRYYLARKPTPLGPLTRRAAVHTGRHHRYLDRCDE